MTPAEAKLWTYLKGISHSSDSIWKQDCLRPRRVGIRTDSHGS